MNRKARWMITVLVVGGIMAQSLIPGLAAEPETVRRLALENRVAEVIANLNLTPAQKEQLKEVAESYRAAQEAVRAELAQLLAERRDALLANDREALAEIERSLEQLAKRDPLAEDESVREFVDGLTERQKQVLAQILPVVGRRSARMQVRELPHPHLLPQVLPHLPPDIRPDFARRMPGAGVRLHLAYGFDSEVVDVLIDLLEQ